MPPRPRKRRGICGGSKRDRGRERFHPKNGSEGLMAQRYRAAILSAESVPFAKVGGLADVIGALSRAIADLGCSVAVFLPRYADLALPEGSELELVARIEV